MADAEAMGGDDVSILLARLEEAVRSVRSALGMMLWVWGVPLTALLLMAGALLTHSFTLGDQISELTAVTRDTGAKVVALQADMAEAKTEIRGMRKDLAAIRAGFGGATTISPDRGERLPR
jgi:hypothetical protein